MSIDELLWKQVNEAVERALCRQRKLEQLDSVTATADEAGAILGLSRTSTCAGIKSKKIPAIVVNRRVLIPIVSLARMLVEADEASRATEEQEGSA